MGQSVDRKPAAIPVEQVEVLNHAFRQRGRKRYEFLGDTLPILPGAVLNSCEGGACFASYL